MMPYSPNEPLDIKVEVQLDGVWTTITDRARSASGVRIKRGYSDGAIQGETSRCRLDIGNDDGWLTEGNPLSPWYPHIGRGTPVRVSLVGILVSDAKRFEGEIEEMVAVYPGGSSSSMRVLATGSLGVVAQNDDPLDSAMYRTSTNNAGIVPIAYWSMEEPSAYAANSANVLGVPSVLSTAWAWSLPGTGPAMEVLVPFGVTQQPGTNATLRGSHPVVSLGGSLSVIARMPTYADTGKWAACIAHQIRPDQTVLDGAIQIYYGDTEPMPATLVYLSFSTNQVGMSYYASYPTGGVTFSATGTLDVDAARSDWVFVTLVSENASSGAIDRLTATVRDSSGELLGTATMLTDSTTHDTVVLFQPRYPGGGGELPGVGHAVFYTDPAFTIGTHDVNLARSMHGWEGEQAHQRLTRLGAEEQLQVSIIGSQSAQMGPQRAVSLFDLFTDCEQVDQGLLADNGPATYRCLDDLYNQNAQVAVTYEALMPDFAPAWDNQQVTNDWTVSRLFGSTARVADEAHVTATRRRLKGTLSVNTFLDSTLPDHAGWLVAKGTTPGPRYSSGGINLRNTFGAQLADTILGLVPGDRLTIASTALPDQHPPYGADQIVIGWEEYLDAYEWEFRPVMVPYGPYAVGIAGDGTDGGGWPQTGAGTVLASDLAIGAISASVTVAGNPFSTTASLTLSPLTLIVGGERLPVTAISGAGPGQTFTVTRTLPKSHLTGAQVQVFQPLYATL